MTRDALFQPFEIIDGDRARGLVLLADHAGRALPEEYGSLGLPAHEFERHIAYDIGAETVTRELARLTGAPAVMARFSRLLIDPNRGEDDPTLIRQLYDGTVIKANYPMGEEERQRRLDRYYRPYHDALGSMVASVAATSGAAPFLLWDSDDRAVKPLLEALRADPALIVGDNEPYDGALRGDTMFRHAIRNGYAHVLIEIRQDLIATPEGAAGWAARLAPMVAAINALPQIHAIRQYGSRTGPL
jgi:predicted N-formylglutamate amidohydrolase